MTLGEPSSVSGTSPRYRQWLSLAVGGAMVMGCAIIYFFFFLTFKAVCEPECTYGVG